MEETEKAKEGTEKAKEQVKVAIDDAKSTLRSLGFDPVGGLLGAYEGLGKTRSTGVGVAFGLVFALCFVFAIYRIPQLDVSFSDDNAIGTFLRVLAVGCVPFIALTIACIAGEKVAGGKGEVSHNGFIAGVSLLPLGVVFLAASLVGVGNLEVVGTVAIVGICLTVLILFTGLTKIGQITDKAASYAVPLMLIASAWLSKVILTAMFS